jgi:hypothetical protein
MIVVSAADLDSRSDGRIYADVYERGLGVTLDEPTESVIMKSMRETREPILAQIFMPEKAEAEPDIMSSIRDVARGS